MASSTSGKTVTLKTYDGEEFVLAETLAMHCRAIGHIIEDECAEDTIPLPNVNAMTLRMVIEYCQKYIDVTESSKTEEGSSSTEGSSKVTEELKKWDREFLNIDLDIMLNVMLAAHYLDFSKLLDATCQKVAELIRGRSPEDIRKTFNIKNDFTPEEEEQIHSENRWAFE